MTKPLNILSLGCGIQSSALYFMSAIGLLNVKFDYAVFADPGREKKETYDYARYMIEWSKQNNSIPIIWCGKKSLYKDLINGTNSTGKRFASLPFYTKDEHGNIGMLRRQCTGEYKIAEVNKAIRKLQEKPKGAFYECNIFMGISVEEIERMSYNDIAKFHNHYPLTGYHCFKGNPEKQDYGIGKMSKIDCAQWLRNNGFRVPPSIACTFCPFQSDAMWLDIKINDPKEWKALVRLDYKIRNSTKKGVKQPIYLHESCVPLDKVVFKNENQASFFECRGACHT